MLSHGGGLLPLLSGARQMREQTGELGREVLVDFTAQRSGDIQAPRSLGSTRRQRGPKARISWS
ncbi:hypothetical protein OIE75_33070 [Streptomyces sp. NBC_01723]|uniref:hypothetical protein n=1 Tax=Streptomyces sp. NBC_01723 TaxID=2975921 RepID=UPI002E331A08|nr:hypothetical protein [Streptomyces sp. NBC_01723]